MVGCSMGLGILSLATKKFDLQMTNKQALLAQGESFVVKDMKAYLVESSSVFTDGTCAFEQLINRTAASGKIVLCFATMGMVSSEGAALAVYAGKGIGVIFADTITRKSTQDNFLPTVHVDLQQGTRILHYIRSSRCFIRLISSLGQSQMRDQLVLLSELYF
ncbi:hypothetical protein EJB05_07947, partial [Eragrostis curvula]